VVFGSYAGTKEEKYNINISYHLYEKGRERKRSLVTKRKRGKSPVS
jgi:hypothetical protein